MPTTPGKRLSSGTRQLSMYTDPVLDALSDSLPGMTAVVRPGVPRSTTNPRTRPSSHRAQMTNTSATGALVIHILDPFSTYDLVSGSALALLSIVPMSLPAFGSVRPKAPTRSAAARRGRYRSFCSAVPYAWIACMTSDDWTLSADLQTTKRLYAASPTGHSADGVSARRPEAIFHPTCKRCPLSPLPSRWDRIPPGTRPRTRTPRWCNPARPWRPSLSALPSRTRRCGSSSRSWASAPSGKSPGTTFSTAVLPASGCDQGSARLPSRTLTCSTRCARDAVVNSVSSQSAWGSEKSTETQ